MVVPAAAPVTDSDSSDTADPFALTAEQEELKAKLQNRRKRRAKKQPKKQRKKQRKPIPVLALMSGSDSSDGSDDPDIHFSDHLNFITVDNDSVKTIEDCTGVPRSTIVRMNTHIRGLNMNARFIKGTSVRLPSGTDLPSEPRDDFPDSVPRASTYTESVKPARDSMAGLKRKRT